MRVSKILTGRCGLTMYTGRGSLFKVPLPQPDREPSQVPSPAHQTGQEAFSGFPSRHRTGSLFRVPLQHIRHARKPEPASHPEYCFDGPGVRRGPSDAGNGKEPLVVFNHSARRARARAARFGSIVDLRECFLHLGPWKPYSRPGAVGKPSGCRILHHMDPRRRVRKTIISGL